MEVDVMTIERPRFDKKQIVPATAASKKFAEVRKNAKLEPQFISDHNEIDSVVLNYDEYEKMFMELNYLRNLEFERRIADRIKIADQNGVRYSIEDVLGKDEFKEFKKIDPDVIPDEDLFE